MGEFHPLGINLPPKHVLGCRERAANAYRVSWRSVQGTKKARLGEHFTPTPKRPPFTYIFRFVHVGWGHRHNHPCQVSSQSVHQFRLPRGSKITISHRLGEWLLQQCYALTCYTVIIIIIIWSSFDVELRRNSSVNEFRSSSGCLFKLNIIFHLQVSLWTMECKIIGLSQEEEIKRERFDVIINFQRVCG